MRMRERPLHGKKYRLLGGDIEVTALDVVKKDYVKVLHADGKIAAVHKSLLNLPVIDTSAYEKLVSH